MSATTIQVRVDSKLKRAAKKVLDGLGLDVSSAIKMYLSQIVETKGIPFRPQLTENGLTPEHEARILKASAEAKLGINTTGPMEADEAIEYLDKIIDENRLSQGF